MEEKEITLKVEDFVQQNFIYENGAKPERGQSLLETGIVDSTGILELVTFLEETFEITVEDEELVPANLDSINNITGFVTRKLSP